MRYAEKRENKRLFCQVDDGLAAIGARGITYKVHFEVTGIIPLPVIQPRTYEVAWPRHSSGKDRGALHLLRLPQRGPSVITIREGSIPFEEL